MQKAVQLLRRQLRNPLGTSPMLRSARHSSELWVLRQANTGIMAAPHNSNSAIR